VALNGMTVGSFLVPRTVGPLTIQLAFKPKAVLLFATSCAGVSTSDSDLMWSMGVATRFENQRVSGMLSDSGTVAGDVERCAAQTSALRIIDQVPQVVVESCCLTLQEAGFIVNCMKVNEGQKRDLRVGYVAFGGDQISRATSGVFYAPTTSGDQEVDLGFAPDGLILWTPTTVSKGLTAFDDATEGGDARFAFGMTDGVNQGYTATLHTNGANPTVSKRRTKTDAVIGVLDSSGVLAEASVVRINANGKLLLSWASGPTAYPICYLALKGPQIAVGSYDQPTSNTTHAVTGVGFQPEGLIVASGGQAASGATNAHGRLALGFASAVGEQLAVAYEDDDAVTPSSTQSAFRTDGMLKALGDGSEPLDTLTSFDADGFTMTASSTDATSRRCLYMALAEDPGPALLEAFLKWPHKEVVVLAEVTPSFIPTGWSLDGTYTNCYTVSVPHHVSASVIVGGVYRRVTKVSENGVLLSESATATLCNAHAGSWFYDETAQLLYVRPTTATDPDEIDALQVFVTFYFASKGVVLDGIYYHPWVVGVPSYQSSVEDLVFGVKKSASGTLEFLNGHAFFDTALPQYEWSNKIVTLLVGGSYRGTTLTRDQYMQLDTLRIESAPVSSEERCQVRVASPVSEMMRVSIPPTPLFEDAYPLLGEGVRGTRKPIVYGSGVTLRPPLVDTSTRTYLVADAAFQSLFAVEAVSLVQKSSTGDVATRVTVPESSGDLHYVADLSACTIVVTDATAAYPITDWQLEVTVTGKPDGFGSYLKTAADIAMDLLHTFGSVPLQDLNYASFARASREFSFEMAILLTSDRTLGSILGSSGEGLGSLERSCFGRTAMDRLGRWSFAIWSPAYDDSVTAMRASQIRRLSPQASPQSVASTARVHFAQNHSTGEWSTVEASSARTRHLIETERAVDLFTFLNDSTGAEVLAARYLALLSRRPTVYDFEEVGTVLAAARAGDKVLITYPRGQTKSGVFDAAQFELISHDRPADLTGGRMALADLGGFADAVGVVASGEGDAWAAVDDDARKANLFVTDGLGYVVPGDETTKDIKVIW